MPYADPVKDRDRKLREIGWTVADYNAAFAAQAGRCALCDRHASEFDKSLAADHCHASGAKRQLLCRNCNVALGQFRDDAALLRRAADYIEKFQQHPAAAA